MVSACIQGKWGSECNQDCPIGCADCHSTTGQCEQCVVGKYGTNCNEDCPSGCDGACDRLTANCEQCKQGFYKDTCEASCPEKCSSGVTNLFETTKQNQNKTFSIYNNSHTPYTIYCSWQTIYLWFQRVYQGNGDHTVIWTVRQSVLMTVTLQQASVAIVLRESMAQIVTKTVLLVVMELVIKTQADVINVSRDSMEMHVMHHVQKTVLIVASGIQKAVIYVSAGSMDLIANYLVEEDALTESAVRILALVLALVAGQVRDVIGVLIIVLHVIAQDAQAVILDTMGKNAN